MFFDGGCRPNPGRMEVAAVARGRMHHRPDVGHGASDEAEWMALLHALDVADALGARDVVLVGDALDVIAQARGRIRCRTATSKHHYELFLSRVATFDRVRLRHVRRGLNLAGIALNAARRA